jgi:transcriptional regulator with XRE-family HTH domain
MKNEDQMDWYMLFHTKSCCDCFQLKESHIYKGVGKMEVWEIIEFVRKQKGISVAELCGKEVSRSVYERFVKNQADTTVSKFSYFLQKLNLGYDELRIFDYPPEVANMDRMMKEMVLAFMNQDKEELQHLISLCEEKGDITQKERHLASLCKLLIARIVDEPIAV